MSRIQANLLLLFVALIWGSTFVVQQVGTGELGAISFTAARFTLGGLVVLPLALRQYRTQRKTRDPFSVFDWLGLVLTGSVLFMGALLQQVGVFNTTVTNAGFLTALYVPLVPLIGLVLFRQLPHWVIWPASLASLLGTYLLSGAQGLDIAPGDLWVIASAFFWAFHVILVGAMASRTQAPLVVAVSQFLVTALLGWMVALVSESPSVTQVIEAWPGVLYAGVLSVGVAFTLQVVGQRYTKAADAAIILSGETLFAAVAGYLFLAERLDLAQLFGCLLILAGMMAVQLQPMMGKKSEEQAAAEA